METVITRAQKARQKEFSPSEIHFNHVRQGKYSGWIISKIFDTLNDEERYQKVCELIEDSLPQKDRERILGFFLFTPLEEELLFDGNINPYEAANKKKNSSSPKKKTATARKNGRAVAKRR